jgi:hypothetical protein
MGHPYLPSGFSKLLVEERIMFIGLVIGNNYLNPYAFLSPRNKGFQQLFIREPGYGYPNIVLSLVNMPE